jgi:hypothetical protein
MVEPHRVEAPLRLDAGARRAAVAPAPTGAVARREAAPPRMRQDASFARREAQDEAGVRAMAPAPVRGDRVAHAGGDRDMAPLLPVARHAVEARPRRGAVE